MNRITKRFATLMAAGLLLVTAAGKAQAVIGIPDDVPAATLLFPFFRAEPNPETNPTDRRDTLFSITNTGVAPGGTTIVHITLWTVRSEHVYDFTIFLTDHDVFNCSIIDLLVNDRGLPTNAVCGPGVVQAPVQARNQLTMDLGGDEGLTLTGYITADVVTDDTFLFPGQVGYPFAAWNLLVGHSYLVNLPQGSATGFNAVSIESVRPRVGHPATAPIIRNPTPAIGGPFRSPYRSFYYEQCIEEGGTIATCLSYDDRERIDGPNGDLVQTLSASITGNDGLVPQVIANLPPNVFIAESVNTNPGGTDSPLSLILRYFSAETLDGRTELWLWKDRNTDNRDLNLAVYDEDENRFSIRFSVPNEVNFLPLGDIVPPGVNGGWFRAKFECGPFGSCAWPTSGNSPLQAVAYSVQFADNLGDGNGSSVELRWDATFPAHRQYTNYIGGPGRE